MKGIKKSLNRCLCPQNNERQQKNPVTYGIRNKKKGRTRGSEYPNTKIWSKKLHQKMSAVSRI